MHYYVDSIIGDDGYSGSLTQPWRSLNTAVNRLEPGNVLSVRDGEYAERIQLSRSGLPEARIVIEPYRGEFPIINGEEILFGSETGWWKQGLFEGRGVSYVDIIGLQLANSKINGFLFDDAAHDFTLVGLRTENTGSGGIWAWNCSRFEIDGVEIVGACVGAGAQEMITISTSTHFIVKNSEVHHGGGGDTGGEGLIFKHGCSYGKAYRNKVHDILKIGVYIGAGGLHSHHLEAVENEVYRVDDTGLACSSERGGLLEDVLFHKNIAHRNSKTGLAVGGWNTIGGPSPMNRIELSRNIAFLNGDEQYWHAGGIMHNNPDAQNVSILDNVVSQNLKYQIRPWKFEYGPIDCIVDGNLIDGFRDLEGETLGENFVERDIVGELMVQANLL